MGAERGPGEVRGPGTIGLGIAAVLYGVAWVVGFAMYVWGASQELHLNAGEIGLGITWLLAAALWAAWPMALFVGARRGARLSWSALLRGLVAVPVIVVVGGGAWVSILLAGYRLTGPVDATGTRVAVGIAASLLIVAELALLVGGIQAFRSAQSVRRRPGP